MMSMVSVPIEIEDHVRTLRKAVVAFGDVRSMLAGAWLLGEPAKPFVQRTHVALALDLAPLLARILRYVLQVVVGSRRQPERWRHSPASASAISFSTE